ncbi:MAG: protein containing Isopropylmalate/citramalate/homocitrate synthase [Candidatus Syntrophoarchaeum caldarius]|uniref:Probable 2-isopropylmalate synthase n=1 Tax=Candidatus Syntropharchaeum caldarium TaxID=1838285 RepID=A0A1F2P854_9EURY|nr:MAG: protein containing Isopropylmalate/citramalate/homocitrate synthase [Candidatus Syntrophoarchaeum caldarius]
MNVRFIKPDGKSETMTYYPDVLRGESVRIFDTTLRDGEQTPGIAFTLEEKVEIARQLDKLGVDVIEAGFPISSHDEQTAVKTITKEGFDATICGLARVIREDIDACIDADVDMVHVFVSTSDIQRETTIMKSRDEVCEISVESVEYVKSHGVQCLFSAMDASRTDLDYLIRIFKLVEEAGVDAINVPDTVGVLVPSMMYNLMSQIRENITVPLDVHCHNDFGLAVANTLMAVEAGARQVQVAINGLGERAGNANLAEVVMSLHSIYGAKTGIRTEYLYETSKILERLTGMHILPNTPIVGENAFSHESGIHAHGVLKASATFEPGIMTPEMVGHKRRIVVGKHTGAHAVAEKLNDVGIEVTQEQLEEILNRVKEVGSKGKMVTDADLYTIAEVVLGELGEQEQVLKLKELSVMTGTCMTSTAVVRAIVRGKERAVAEIGVGPVDAALNAVKSLFSEFETVKLRDLRIDAITGGSDALADVMIAVEDEKGRIVTARGVREDIVLASVDALVSGINRLFFRKKRN